MMKIVFSCVAALATAGLIGCSTPALGIDEPYAITGEKVALLKKGETTIEEVQKLFGPPEMEVPTPSGMTRFYKDLNLNALWVKFNEQGKVRKFRWSD